MRSRPSVRPSDIVTAARALLEREREAARERMRQGGRVRKVSGPSEARDVVGRMFGISGRQVEKMIEVADAAEADPDRFGAFLKEMDDSGSVNGPHTKVKRLQDELRVMSIVPRQARVRTLVMDHPWPDEDVSDSQGHAYALMSIEEMAALPVQDWTDENSHLYLWSRSNTIQIALRLMGVYGFDYRAMLTWSKEHWGMGRYFRNSGEYILFGTRGQLPTRSAGRSTRTVHAWPRPKAPESTKPDEFYDLVRACSYPPFGEAFQRTPRADFLNMFVDTRQEAAE